MNALFKRKKIGYEGATGSVELGFLLRTDKIASSILNVGAGDTTFSFDKSNPAEVIRARRIVKDMLRRGYALLVEVEVNGEKQFTRALDFNETTDRYIVADFDPSEAEHETEITGGAQAVGEPTGGTAKPAKKSSGKKTSVDAASTRAIASPRSAGG